MTDRLTNEELAAIQDRLDSHYIFTDESRPVHHHRHRWFDYGRVQQRDITALLAEIQRLQVGIRKAASDVDGWNDGVRDDLLTMIGENSDG